MEYITSDNEGEGSGEIERFDDSLTLQEITTEMKTLSAGGYFYPLAIAREAMLCKRISGSWLENVPLYIICEVIMEDQAEDKDNQLKR